MRCSKCGKDDVHIVYKTPEEWWVLACLICDNIEEHISDEKMNQMTSGFKPYTVIPCKHQDKDKEKLI